MSREGTVDTYSIFSLCANPFELLLQGKSEIVLLYYGENIPKSNIDIRRLQFNYLE